MIETDFPTSGIAWGDYEEAEKLWNNEETDRLIIYGDESYLFKIMERIAEDKSPVVMDLKAPMSRRIARAEAEKLMYATAKVSGFNPREESDAS